MENCLKINKYEIKSVLGKGAMGVVYEGYDPLLQRQVAIKTIHKTLLSGDGGKELLVRFKREAQATGKLKHPNVVTIYEYGEDDGTPFIAMELIHGKGLRDLIREQMEFKIDQILDILNQTLEALQYVHNAGVVHRDIKPANIIILTNGQIKVTDFGIAGIENTTMTQMGTIMGTPSYMSPEQFMGQRVDARADLFSVGVVLYELLTGVKPFPGKTVTQIMQKVLNAPVENPTTYNIHLSPSFNALIQKALSKRAEDRFNTAQEFKQALLLASQGLGSTTFKCGR
ncbi:MAG: serine/threonine protein kinase [Magnetococcus sp. DMHC-6]